ncbi:MAG: tetratricopeptide repeat protein [Burkholderiales bacterium]
MRILTVLAGLKNWFSPARRAGRHVASGRRAECEGRLAAAGRHYRAAISAAPGHADAHLSLGIVLETLGDAPGAIASYEAALAIDPGNAFAGYNLGKGLLLRGDLERAAGLLRAALAIKPDFPEAHVVLSRVLELQGQVPSATEALKAAIRLRPGYGGALRNLGILYHKLQQWDEAVAALKRAVLADPSDADAHYWLGSALVRAELPAEAEIAYRQAVAMRPQFAEAWSDLGNVLADRGLRDEAAHCLERSLQLNPGYAGAHLGMGNVLAGGGRLSEAAHCYRRALELDPHLLDANINLGSSLKDQGHWQEALQHYRAALALSPEAAEVRWLIAMCHIPAVREPEDDLTTLRERFGKELIDLERWFDDRRVPSGWKAVGVAQPFMLAYQDASNRELLQRYGELCVRLMRPWQAQHVPRPGPRPARAALRIGVVCKYFRDHSVWNALMRGWFQHLDPERFALHAFCLDAHEDAETRFARSRAARFEQGHAGLRQWAAVIADARPDVLIYPEIGMDPMTVKLASLRLAPVQVATWGHPETSGLPTIDCYLSAAAFEPPEAQDHYSERLVTLPHLGCCVQPSQVNAETPALDPWGIEPGVPLLVCPGAPFKYAPEHDALYAEIAQRLGRCRLVFFTHRTPPLSERLRARLERAFQARGLSFGRYVSFVPWLSRSEFFGLMRCADAMLDTIGFSGFNTALQALECGLPVVGYEGRFLRGRLASGLLRHMGMHELVATDVGGYVALAVKLASDASYREGVRQRLESARQVLYRDAVPIRALERFLEGAAAGYLSDSR